MGGVRSGWFNWAGPWSVSAGAMGLLVGCASDPATRGASPFARERRITITSDPPGAAVRLNERAVGVTPLEVDFTWFGVYDVVLTKAGYEPLITTGEADPRLHDVPVFDVVADVLPGREVTRIAWHYTLEPVSGDTDGVVLGRASELRSRFEEVGEPEAAELDAGEPSAP